MKRKRDRFSKNNRTYFRHNVSCLLIQKLIEHHCINHAFFYQQWNMKQSCIYNWYILQWAEWKNIHYRCHNSFTLNEFEQFSEWCYLSKHSKTSKYSKQSSKKSKNNWRANEKKTWHYGLIEARQKNYWVIVYWITTYHV